MPEPPFWGVREIEVDRDELYSHLDTHVLFKLHWGGRGVKGEEWRRLLEDDFRPRLERMWREADYLHPRALLGYFPCYSEGNEIVVLDPEDRETVLERLVAPRQPNGDRICLADFYRPKDSGELDVVALQAVTVGDEVTELMARLEAEGEFAEQLFTHGLGVQVAEGLAEWLHWRVRADLGIPATQGRRYSWGYPAIPEQSEHEKVDTLLRLERIGMQLTGGYAPQPEQSTLAIVAHHPEAIYFGTTSGRLLPDGHKGRADDVIKGSPRDPSLFGRDRRRRARGRVRHHGVARRPPSAARRKPAEAARGGRRGRGREDHALALRAPRDDAAVDPAIVDGERIVRSGRVADQLERRARPRLRGDPRAQPLAGARPHARVAVAQHARDRVVGGRPRAAARRRATAAG